MNTASPQTSISDEHLTHAKTNKSSHDDSSAEASPTQLSHIARMACLGGGHGLFATLRAARTLSDDVSAIVTVADDGGSSGRLRKEFNSIPPGDLRMALAALAADDPEGRLWESVLQHRFGGRGALAGHAVGNLIIQGLIDVMGDEVEALAEVAKLMRIRGRVLPMSPEPLDIEAEVAGLEDDPRVVSPVRGQVAVATTPGQVRRVKLIPENPPSSAPVIDAIMNADVVTLGPGSWFSSVVPHILVPDVVKALQETQAHKVVVVNLVAEPGETPGFTVERHLHMLQQHCQDLSLDTVIVDEHSVTGTRERMHLSRAAANFGAELTIGDVRHDDEQGRWLSTHSPRKLARVLSEVYSAAQEQKSVRRTK
ncbi:gluconeogenesis factor YvcK family protein [Corynebacterium pseudokroppenstedtii]|uniref:gluconeogenesis factor YvcK family protein n=1 Tax=Corynebacterium pseudokroppenstedtii TaxID=2804917 RepID=UPI00351D2F6B